MTKRDIFHRLTGRCQVYAGLMLLPPEGLGDYVILPIQSDALALKGPNRQAFILLLLYRGRNYLRYLK